jgi:hypothetical protein
VFTAQAAKHPLPADPGTASIRDRWCRFADRQGGIHESRLTRRVGNAGELAHYTPGVVQRFRRKPQKTQDRGLAAAQYAAGGPLGDLQAVAAMTGDGSAVAECALPDETVLVARWVEHPDDRPPAVRFEVVKDGDWLYYSETYDSLGDDTTRGIEQFYEPAE